MRAQAASGIDFDAGALTEFLDRTLSGGPHALEIDRIGGGQSNPTYFVTRGDTRLVLRKPPPVIMIKSAHDVAREFRIIKALWGTPVPVPEPVLFVDDPDVIGTPFYLMGRLDGVVHMDADLADVEVGRRRDLYLAHARLMAGLHTLDPEQIGLGDFVRPGSFIQRQARRWCDVWDDDRAGDIARVRDFLVTNLPADEGRSLVHGDLKFNNVIVDVAAEHILGVLDWELAAVGDPLLDIAHMWAATWATTPGEYGGILGLDLAGNGLPDVGEYEDAYVAAGGARGGLSPFYRVLALLRYAGIFRGVGQRASAGVATSADAAQQGELAHVYLDRALAVIDER